MSEVIRQLVERWNAGDFDGTLDLYTDDARMLSSPHWPEQFEIQGREAIKENIDDWVGAWESSEIEFGSLEEYGDKVVGSGFWLTRGRASGAEGRMPIAIMFTLRHGKIAVLEWFDDHDAAVRAARGA